MKITFLGTGTSQGVPVIACNCECCLSKEKKDKRLRSSILIQDKGLSVIIDAGPDFRQQILKINLKKLDAILITHGHKDHIGGLDDVRAFNYQQNKSMDVYVGDFAKADVKREFYYAFEGKKYPGTPKINLINVTNHNFNIEHLSISPIFCKHYINPVLAYRIGDFTYITDCNFIPENEFAKLRGTKILVINALRKEKHISHFNLQEALEIINIIKPEKAFITHISHLMGTYNKISTELPANVKLAVDGLSFEL